MTRGPLSNFVSAVLERGDRHYELAELQRAGAPQPTILDARRQLLLASKHVLSAETGLKQAIKNDTQETGV